MPFPDPLDQPLAAADQACKECRRRKAKCDRGIPTCVLCIRYNRHCLYEKHSKTPLTRKHLTEVEEKLERAEALLRQARLVALGDTNSSSSYVENTLNAVQNTGVHNFDFSNLQDPIPGFFAEASPPGRRFFSQTPDLPSYGSLANPSLQTPFLGEQENGEESQSTANAEHLLESGMNADEETQNAPNPLECPPTDDFEWDEQYASVIESAGQDHSHWTSKTNEAEGEEDVIDGMASLTVDEREGGYLGVASGAALLRIIDPQSHTRKKSSTLRRQPGRFSFRHAESAMPLYDMPNSNRHILDTMIDSYFRLYHVSYPVIHEPTFRAQYSEVIPRPNGDCWLVLAYVIAAIGVYTTSTSLQDNDLPLFSQAKSMLSINFLEAGNLTLVQALVLISNYLQKRNKPNSGYNYIGLAVRMAMGLGLHKEFQGWNISPLKMEIRRRVWWTLGIFELGATITFSRPMAWPSKGIEVAFPMNVNDRDLTVASTAYPTESDDITPYTAVRTQAAFHVATKDVYTRVISKPFPTASELLHLDESSIGDWQLKLPIFWAEQAFIPPKYSFAHAVMMWRYRNFRIIMYRPFVIRKALHARNGKVDQSLENQQAYERCLEEARCTIATIRDYWDSNEHNRLAGWYALYFLFQAALIPCICFRNSPSDPQANEWRTQILTTLSVISSLAQVNSSSARCHQVIMKLCGQYLRDETVEQANLSVDVGEEGVDIGPIDESPQTQMNNLYSMMWPNVPALEADVVMQDDGWMEFLRGEDPDFANFDGEAQPPF